LNLENLLSIPMNQEYISISITWNKVEYNLILYFFEFTGIPLNTTLHSLGIQCNIEILGCHSVRFNLEELLSIPMHQEYISISITWNKVEYNSIILCDPNEINWMQLNGGILVNEI
jgi:hypothetical protein